MEQINLTQLFKKSNLRLAQPRTVEDWLCKAISRLIAAKRLPEKGWLYNENRNISDPPDVNLDIDFKINNIEVSLVELMKYLAETFDDAVQATAAQTVGERINQKFQAASHHVDGISTLLNLTYDDFFTKLLTEMGVDESRLQEARRDHPLQKDEEL